MSPLPRPARRSGAHRSASSRENGGIGLLLVGFVAILVSLVLLGIDTTSLYLARIETLNAADAAARDAADEISDDSYYGQQETVLDPAAVDAAARRSLARQQPSARIATWQVVSATPTDGGRSATVTVTSQVQVPVTDLVRGWIPEGTAITVESTARGAQAASQP